jgi:hypothetical protein
MNNKADYIIGIDPDTDKSGVAQLRVAGREMEAFSNSFPELLDYLQRMAQFQHRTGMKVLVVVEDSWRISHIWKAQRGVSVREIEKMLKIAENVGRCHAVGMNIVECARYYGLEVKEQLPLKKIWKGKDGKITHDEISVFIRMGARSNQETRDAALLAWNEAGFPIRIITKNR